MNTLKLLVVSALVAVSAAGCAITRVCNSDGGIEILQEENGKTDVRIDDICFRDGLAVEDIALRRNSVGILTATIVVRNTLVDMDDHNRMDPFAMQYKVTWFDAGGMAVAPDLSLWEQMRLDGGATESIKVAAPTKEATRFVLRIKHVR